MNWRARTSSQVRAKTSRAQGSGRSHQNKKFLDNHPKSLDVESLDKIISEIPPKFYKEKEKEGEDFNPFDYFNYDDTDDNLVDTEKHINVAVDMIVANYYQGFNTATANFGKILTAFTESQQFIDQSDANIKDSIQILNKLSSSNDLIDLWEDYQIDCCTLEILEKIDYLKDIPKVLDIFLQKKQYLHIVYTLQGATNLLLEMCGIEVLHDIQTEVFTKKRHLESKLTELLIEDIFDTQNSLSLSKPIGYENSLESTRESDALIQKMMQSKYSPFSHDHLLREETSTSDLDIKANCLDESAKEDLLIETSQKYIANPKGNRQDYLRLIIAALDKVGNLQSVKNKLNKGQVIKDNLRKIVDREKKKLKEAFSSRVHHMQKLSPSGKRHLLSLLIGRIGGSFISMLKRRHQTFNLINKKLTQNCRKINVPFDASQPIVWDSIQMEMMWMLCSLLESDRKLNHYTKAHTKRQRANAQEDLTFNFSDSRLTSIADNRQKKSFGEEEKLSRKDEVKSSWIEPSPKNIIYIYQPVRQFIDQIVTILGVNSSSENLLGKFMLDFFKQTFIPQLKKDIEGKVDAICNDSSAFNAREHLEKKYSDNTNDKPYFLLKSILEFEKLIRTTYSELFFLTEFVLDFIRHIRAFLNIILSKFLNKYKQVTKNSYCYERLNNLAMFKILENDRLYTIYRKEEKEDTNMEYYNFFSSESELYGLMYRENFSLQRSQMILDVQSWELLALMSQSLDWLAERLYMLLDPDSWEHPRMPNRNGSKLNLGLDGKLKKKSKNQSSSFQQQPSIYSSMENTQFFKTRSKKEKYLKTKIDKENQQRRIQIATHVQTVATKCLFTLRLETHMHFFFYLKDMRVSSYSCNAEPSEPEAFIVELNKDWMLNDEVLRKYFSISKMKYILGGAAELITTILIHSLKTLQDKRINKKGQSKIRRNISALQQCLTHISQSSIVNQKSGGDFNHARDYFRLLTKTDEELDRFVLDNPTMFSTDDYNAIRTIRTRLRPQPKRIKMSAWQNNSQNNQPPSKEILPNSIPMNSEPPVAIEHTQSIPPEPKFSSIRSMTSSNLLSRSNFSSLLPTSGSFNEKRKKNFKK